MTTVPKPKQNKGRGDGSLSAKDHFSAIDEGLVWMRERGTPYREIGGRFGVSDTRAQQMYRRANHNRAAFVKAHLHLLPLLAALQLGS